MIELEIDSESAFFERVFRKTSSIEVVDDAWTIVLRMVDEPAVDWLDLILIEGDHGAERIVVGDRHRDASMAVSDVKDKLKVALWYDDVTGDNDAGDGNI